MRHSDLNNITTITEALQALENVGANIEQLKLQVEFPDGKSEDTLYKARYALMKQRGIRTALCNRLAILRQKEKEQRSGLQDLHTEYLIEEMRRYFSKPAFLACDHRAKLRAEADHGSLDHS